MIMEVVTDFVESAIWVYFQTAFHGSSQQGVRKMGSIAAITFGLTANILLADHFVLYSPYTTVIDFALLILYSAYCVKGKWYWKLFTIIVYNLCLFCINFFCLAIFHNAFLIPTEMLIQPGSEWRLAILLTTKLLLILFVFLMLWIRRGFKIEIGNNLTIILIPLFLMVIVSMLESGFQRYYELTNDVTGLILLLATISILMMISLYLLKGSLQEREQRLQNQMLQSQLKVQEQAYTEIYRNVRSVRKIQHDMKHRLVVAEQLIHQGDIENGEAYLKGFLQELDSVETFSVEESIWRTILSIKKQKAEEKNIRCQIDIQEQGLKKIQPVDLCVLLGNLLDNAIEAEVTLEADREIHVILREAYGLIFIRVDNRIGKSIPETGNKAFSSKSNPMLHGFGVPCINTLVDQYEGRIEIQKEKDMYSVRIWI